MASFNINGIEQLVLNFEGTTTAALTAPGEITVSNTLPIATTSSTGVVQPDGTTITITPGGIISSTGGTGVSPVLNIVTASRVLGTVYTNPGPSGMFVMVSGQLSLGVGHTASMIGSVNGADVIVNTISNGSGFTNVAFWVPAGATYVATSAHVQPGDTDIVTLLIWVEYTF